LQNDQKGSAVLFKNIVVSSIAEQSIAPEKLCAINLLMPSSTKRGQRPSPVRFFLFLAIDLP